MMNERTFRYGENNRGLGMTTLPEKIESAPVVVLLNAGLLYRAEPYRLNVLLSRALADIGYICIRVDLSKKGDTPTRGDIPNRESVNLDWEYIKKSIFDQFGKRNIIIFGLCSGADNGIKIAAYDSDVKGLILLDPISRKDTDFKKRDFLTKISNPHRWKTIPKSLFNRVIKVLYKSNKLQESSSGLRDEPHEKDLDNCFINIRKHNGQVLAVFTSHQLVRYNKIGQFAQTLSAKDVQNHLEEVFWPDVEHLYSIQSHRDRLIEKIKAWGKTHLHTFKLRFNE